MPFPDDPSLCVSVLSRAPFLILRFVPKLAKLFVPERWLPTLPLAPRLRTRVVTAHLLLLSAFSLLSPPLSQPPWPPRSTALLSALLLLLARMSGQTARDAGQQSESVRGRIGLGAAAGGFDSDIYGAAGAEEGKYARELTDEGDDEQMGDGSGGAKQAESSYSIARAEAAHTAGPDVNPFEAHRTEGRVSDRDNEYTARRLNRGFSPVRKDAFAEEIESGKAAAAQPKGKKAKAAAAAAAAASDENVRSYKDIMLEQQLAREEAAVLKNIEKKRVEEEARRAAGGAEPVPAAAAAAAPADGTARKRRRWGEPDDGSSAAKTAADMPSASSESLLDSSENWAAAPQPSADEDEQEGEEDQFAQPGAPPKELNSWDATPVNLPAAGTKNKRSRWDQADATPLSAALSSSAADATPLHIPMAGSDVTPLYSGAETPVGAPPGTATKKRSRWGETPIHSSLAAATANSTTGTGPTGMATPLHMSSAEWKQRLEAMTPDQLQALRAEAEIAARNQPMSDEELDALLPGEKDGFQILVPPESYKPIRTPARKLLMTPLSAFGGQEGFFIPIDAPGIKYDVPPTPAESGLPAFQKEEDSKYFGALLEEVDESRLTSGELKERRIMKLLLKIKVSGHYALVWALFASVRLLIVYRFCVCMSVCAERHTSSAQDCFAHDHGQGARVWCGPAVRSDFAAADVPHSGGWRAPCARQGHRSCSLQARRSCAAVRAQNSHRHRTYAD